MDTSIQEFLKGKKFALVGVSRSGGKFGNAIYTELKGRGFDIRIVHPEAKEIDGAACVPNLKALGSAVDGVIICVSPNQAAAVVQDGAQAGIKNVWLQQGADSAEAVAAARQAGMNVVAGKCILMYAPPVRSFHGFHRAISSLFGQL
jgi:predicted CoA-binding protein